MVGSFIRGRATEPLNTSRKNWIKNVANIKILLNFSSKRPTTCEWPTTPITWCMPRTTNIIWLLWFKNKSNLWTTVSTFKRRQSRSANSKYWQLYWEEDWSIFGAIHSFFKACFFKPSSSAYLSEEFASIQDEVITQIRWIGNLLQDWCFSITW